MRDFSVLVKERNEMNAIYKPTYKQQTNHRAEFINDLRQALYFGITTVYAQGMSILSVASKKYDYDLNLEAIARIWRGGCIIRAAMLEDFLAAFKIKSDLVNLLLDANLSKKLIENQKYLRNMVAKGVEMGIPVPGLMSSLGYLDTICSNWLPDNLIQAQRDYFGSHQYQRTDLPGSFHTEWEQR
jgi:6-phosphogluconate dehydrogenase